MKLETPLIIIAIGRNEGPRLARCLESLRPHPVIYVDSGSSDNSLTIAAEHGAQIVQLTPPYSAARARNAGFNHFLQLYSSDPLIPQFSNASLPIENRKLKIENSSTDYSFPAFIFFLDADCELLPEFLPAALAAMQSNPAAAIVCGRRRERHPEASVYNTLIDLEWDTPIGEVESCGGDALMRTAALLHLIHAFPSNSNFERQGVSEPSAGRRCHVIPPPSTPPPSPAPPPPSVPPQIENRKLKIENLFNPSLIAGEEPEFCHRIRHLTPEQGAPVGGTGGGGYKILRIDSPMTLHDAHILHLGPFLRRYIRSGYGGLDVESKTRGGFFAAEIRRARLWAAFLPLAILVTAILAAALRSPFLALLPLALAALYPLQFFRLFLSARRRGLSISHAAASAALTLLVKFPQILGQLRWQRDRLVRRPAQLIEYKTLSPAQEITLTTPASATLNPPSQGVL